MIDDYARNGQIDFHFSRYADGILDGGNLDLFCWNLRGQTVVVFF